MRAKELRERSDDELKTLEVEARNKLFQARMRNATHQLTNTSDLNKNRREIARIQTILRERRTTTAQNVAQE